MMGLWIVRESWVGDFFHHDSTTFILRYLQRFLLTEDYMTQANEAVFAGLFLDDHTLSTDTAIVMLYACIALTASRH